MKSIQLKGFVISLIFVLFLNSGSLKWLDFWPLDPTLLLGIVCVFFVIIKIVLSKEKKFTTPFVIKVFLFLLLWIFISCIYSPSKTYYLEKFNRTLLLLISIIFPIFIFKNRDWIIKFREAFSIFGISCLVLLTTIYVQGGYSLNNYFITSNTPNSNIPDYLTIGQILGILFFINLSKNTLFWVIIKAWVFLMIIMLSGRGPALFLVVIFILNYIIKSHFTTKTVIISAIFLILIPFLSEFFFTWSGAEVITSRFQSLIHEDQSLITRENLFKQSTQLIAKHPFFGIGYGGFGITVDHKDGRAYPHNIFLEIFVETGIIGFACLLFFFIYLFRTYLKRLYYTNKNNVATDFCLAFVFVFMQSLKSSSIVDVRLLFGLAGILIVMIMHNKFTLSKSMTSLKVNRLKPSINVRLSS